MQVAYTGMLFFVMSFVLQERGLFDAFYMQEMSTYAGLVFFGLLFTPVDMALSLLVNAVSRRNEFQADAFAAGTTGSGDALVTALKKLSADSLTNLTPHPLHVVRASKTFSEMVRHRAKTRPDVPSFPSARSLRPPCTGWLGAPPARR